jgi:hypothetical protein
MSTEKKYDKGDYATIAIVCGIIIAVVSAISWLVFDINATNKMTYATMRKEAEDCKPYGHLKIDEVPAKCLLYFQGK